LTNFFRKTVKKNHVNHVHPVKSLEVKILYSNLIFHFFFKGKKIRSANILKLKFDQILFNRVNPVYMKKI